MFLSHLTQQDAKVEKVLSCTDMLCDICLVKVPYRNPQETHRLLEKIISAEKLPAWTERNREVYNEERLRENHQNSIDTKQPQNTTELPTYAFFRDKKMTHSEGRTISPESGAKSHRELFPSFKN